MKQYKIYLILILLTVGCATRDNTEFRQFSEQITLLSEETSLVLQSVVTLSELNRSEAIAEQNPELLEATILQRTGTYSLTGDTTVMHFALLNLISSSTSSTDALLYYALLLEELTNQSDFTIATSDLLNPYLGNFASVISVFVHQGKIEKSTAVTQTMMHLADSTVSDVSNNIAVSLQVTANSVQAIYVLMSARRQREIITEGYPIELVEELLQLNSASVEILSRLELLNKAWKILPGIHRELASTLSENSTSATLKILGTMLLDLREEQE